MVITAQLLRYAVVGLASNIILYAGYLLFTSTGMGHKLAMTSMYLLGILQTFFVNRRWFFEHQGRMRQAFVRYVATYAFGYLLNFALLMLLVDKYSFPHQVVQGILIVIVAMTMFLLQKYWAFVPDTHETVQGDR